MADLPEVDLLALWSEGLTFTDIIAYANRNRKDSPMYQHIVTLVVSGRSAQTDQLVDGLRWEAVNLGFTVDGGYPTVVTKVLLDPNARITNDRLRAYHAKMRSVGIQETAGRHAVIRLAIGHDIAKASSLTNAEFDKVMAALDG